MNSADVIATCALLFTVASFWWLYARPGKLRIVGEPRSYSFAASRQLLITLPLVFSNSGPTPVVAINLRLRLDTPGFPDLVPFVATRDGVKPKEDSTGREMATSIVLQGRDTWLICCEFVADGSKVEHFDKAVNLGVTIEALVWRRWRQPVWKPLLTFPLRLPTSAVANRSQYVTYDNQAATTPTTP